MFLKNRNISSKIKKIKSYRLCSFKKVQGSLPRIFIFQWRLDLLYPSMDEDAILDVPESTDLYVLAMEEHMVSFL